MFKALLAVVILAHGIGHSMGLLQVFKVATVNPEWNGDSWVLTGIAGTTVTHAVGAVVWTVAMVGFAALAATIVGWLPASWFSPLAVVSAAASLVGLVLFPVAFPTFSTIGILAVNVGVLAAALWFHWGPADLV